MEIIIFFSYSLIALLAIAGISFGAYLFQRQKTQRQRLEREIKKMQTMLKETGALEVGGVQRKLDELNEKEAQTTHELEQAKLQYEQTIHEIEQQKKIIEEYKLNTDIYKQKIEGVEQQYKDCVDFGPEIPEAYGMYDRVLLLENSAVYKNKIDEIRKKEKELIRVKAAIITDTKMDSK